MSLNKKLFWGGLGWVLGGPIGGILGYAWASMSDAGSLKNYQKNYSKSSTQAGDFIVSLMVLFAKVMKADNKLLRSELNYVKDFLNKELKSLIKITKQSKKFKVFKGITCFEKKRKIKIKRSAHRNNRI